MKKNSSDIFPHKITSITLLCLTVIAFYSVSNFSVAQEQLSISGAFSSARPPMQHIIIDKTSPETIPGVPSNSNTVETQREDIETLFRQTTDNNDDNGIEISNVKEDDSDILFFQSPNNRAKTLVSSIQSISPNYEMIEKLLTTSNSNIDTSVVQGNTMLILGSMQNNPSHVDFALSHGANITKTNNQGQNALHWASYNHSTKILKQLISQKPDVSVINLADKSGKTPLHFAALNSDVESIKILIMNKANIKALDNDGRSPLFYALTSRNYEGANLLLKLGASFDQKDKQDISLEDLLLNKGSVEAFINIYDKVPPNTQMKILDLLKDTPQSIHRILNKDISYKQHLDMQEFGIDKNEEVI